MTSVFVPSLEMLKILLFMCFEYMFNLSLHSIHVTKWVKAGPVELIVSVRSTVFASCTILLSDTSAQKVNTTNAVQPYDWDHIKEEK